MKRTMIMISALVMIATVLSLMVGVVNALAESKPRPPIAELDMQTVPSRTIYNVCTNPQHDYNSDGHIDEEDAHVDVYYDGRFGNGVWLGIFRDLRCDDDTSMAMVRVFMLANTTRRVFDSRLYMWTGALSVVCLDGWDNVFPGDDPLAEFDAWEIAQWQDNNGAFEMWCNPVWSDIPTYHHTESNPYAPITAFCADPQHDYNSDGQVNASDMWVQVEFPHRNTAPVEIWLTQFVANAGDPCTNELLYTGDGNHYDFIRLFVQVASGTHNLHSVISIVIPSGAPYEGDVLDYATFSEDGVYYDHMNPDAPVEYN